MKFNQTFSTILFILAIAIFSLTSCGDDEGDITGTYTLVQITSTGCADAEENISFDLSGDGCQDLDGIEVCVVGTMTISDATFSVQFTITGAGVSQSTTASGDYTIDGNMITICDADGCQSSTFNASDDVLTIRIPEDEDGCVLTIRGEK